MNLNFKKEMNVNVWIAGGAAAGLLAAGGIGGWFAARANLSRGFYQRLDEEMDAIRRHYLNKAAKDASPEAFLDVAPEDDSAAPDLAGDFDEKREWAPESGDAAADEAEGGPRNAFDDYETERPPGEHAVSEDAAVVESEEDERDHSRPYPISPAEAANTGPEWDAIALTFYADGVLTDSNGEPVPNYVKIVGELRPELFGGISGAKNLRLVRNDERECDFEITMYETTYAEFIGYGKPV